MLGAARVAGEIPRGAGGRNVDTVGEFVGFGFADDDGARGGEALHDGGVERGDEALQRSGAGFGGNSGGVADVFDGDGHTVEWTYWRWFAVEGGRLRARGVGHDVGVGVDCWLGLVDAGEGRFDGLAGGDFA